MGNTNKTNWKEKAECKTVSDYAAVLHHCNGYARKESVELAKESSGETLFEELSESNAKLFRDESDNGDILRDQIVALQNRCVALEGDLERKEQELRDRDALISVLRDPVTAAAAPAKPVLPMDTLHIKGQASRTKE